VHGWAYSRSDLRGCCRPASGYTVARGVSESNEPTASSNQELGEYKRSVGSFPRLTLVSFSCFPGFCLVLDPRGRLGRLGVLVRNWMTVTVEMI